MWPYHLKTSLLLATLTGLLLCVGSLVGGSVGLYLAGCTALFMHGIAYFFSAQLVLRLYKAQPLDEQEYAWIYRMVHTLANTMHLPMPKLWLIPTPMANAFATGRTPHHGSVALTQGILVLLDRHELQGVLAHELAHIKNRDTLVTTTAAALATALGKCCHLLRSVATGNRARSGNKREGNPVILFLIALLMPIIATITQLAVSRSREYCADEIGAYYTKDPLALAAALTKLHQHVACAPSPADDLARATTASLQIVHPFTSDSFTNLFSTHPPVHERITRLNYLHEQKIKSYH
jgi:heat shock protein HtpX